MANMEYLQLEEVEGNLLGESSTDDSHTPSKDVHSRRVSEALTLVNPMVAEFVGGGGEVAEEGGEGVDTLETLRKNFSIQWKDLVVSVPATKQELLHSLNGVVRNGFWAILGASGSGKTTLMNCLAKRLGSTLKESGYTLINGKRYASRELKQLSGYVMQADLLSAFLTLRETLELASRLRLPGLSPAERHIALDRIIEDMRLGECQHVRIGSVEHKGLSGGEKKRLSVAVELLTNPLLLFLDEPTSGLDSENALSLCQLLKQLTVRHNTVVISTIHQPQESIYFLFDSMVLLSHGQQAYLGPAGETAIRHFEQAGFPIPLYKNPADHFLAVLSSNTGHKALVEQNSQEKASSFQLPPNKLVLPSRSMAPWSTQCGLLFVRCMKEYFRRSAAVITMLVQTLVLSVLIGTVFLDLGSTQSDIPKHTSLIFFCCINQGVFGSTLILNSFPGERAQVLRERASGMYLSSAYFVAKSLADTLTTLFTPVLFSLIVYFLVGFQATTAKFFIFTVFMILEYLSAVSLTLAVSTLCRSTDVVVAIVPTLFEVTRLYSGFFLPPDQLPVYYSWLDDISYLKYGYIGGSINQLDGMVFTCTSSQYKPYANGSLYCPTTSGEQRIQQLGFENYSIGGCIGYLLLFVFVCRFIAYVGLRFVKV